MFSKYIAILFICLILTDGVISMTKSKNNFQNNRCKYKRKSANMRTSKLIKNGGHSEINGTIYRCSDSSMLKNLRTEIEWFKFGETSVTDHQIRKRIVEWIFFSIFAAAAAAAAAAVIICAIFCPRKAISNNPPTLICPDDGKVIYAERSNTTAKHSWPAPAAKDPEGDSIKDLKLIHGGPNGSEFKKGSHSVTYEVSDSKGAKSTCSFSFTVKVITCQDLQLRGNGNLTCDGEFIYGSSCTIACTEGYEMLPSTSNNEQVITCETDGVSGIHSESPNSCKVISCPADDPGLNPLHGEALCTSSDFAYKTVCSTRCKSGYIPLDKNTIECQANKTWSNSLRGCTDNEKPVVNDCPAHIYRYAERNSQPTRVFWTEPTAVDNSGEATIKQIEGQSSGSLFSPGSHKIVYTAYDAEGNEPPNCTFYINIQDLMCTPPTISDRYLTYTCPTGYNFGSYCELGCMGSFPLVGNDTITCEQKKTGTMVTAYWDVGNEMPYCKTNPCNPLTPPGNGAISCAAWLFGLMCTMQCQEKFDIPYGIKTNDGSSNFNGQFICSKTTGQYHPSNIVPNCSESRDVSSSLLPGEFYYFVGDCNDLETLVQIKENFIKVMEQLEISAYAGVCPNTTECNVYNTNVTCGPVTGKRKRSADEAGYNWYNVPVDRYRRSIFRIRVSFSLKTSWQNFRSSVHTYNLMKLIQQNIFDIIKDLAVNGSFNVSGLDPDINSFSSGLSEPECPEGTAIKKSTMNCVPCSIGTFLDKSDPSRLTCRNCPQGYYKDSEHTTTCTPCPQDTFTLGDGAESVSECLDKCDIGEFSSSGLMPCNICPRGTFSSIKMSTTCELCPHGKTSLSKSTAVDNCTDIDITFAKNGDAIFMESNQFLESKSVALFTWIKNDNSSLVLLHGNSSSFYVTIKYGRKTVLVDINGSKHSLIITGDMQDWHHVAIIISTETDTISVYINGAISAQTSLNGGRNVSVITPDLSFSVVLTEDASSDISISGYQITSNIPSDDEIIQHSSSCNYTRSDAIVTLSDVDWTAVDNSLIKTRSQCDNVNQCIQNPCNGHPCIDLVGNFRCDCNDGFTGETCEVPPDYCIIAPCQNGGVCQNGNNTYACTCSGSYRGANCEITVVNGRWSAWSDFSECSVTCNGGIKTRSRVCNNPIPDPEGLQCDSSLSTESLPCNTEACPSCAELKLSFGNVVNCSDINGEKVCEVSCIVGYTFVPGNLPLKEYRCGQSTGYTWNGLTPACGKAEMPDRLSSTTVVEYNSSISCVDSSTVLNTLQSNLESSLSCYKHGICELSTTINECEDKIETNSLQIILTATLPHEDLDLGHFYSTGNLSKALQSLVNIVTELENSTRKINESIEILSFNMGGVKYLPSSQQATGTVVCRLGQGSDGPICIDCPMGTYSTTRKCLLCPQGTYQSEIGGTKCTNCPSGLTTKYEGSQDAANCSEVTNTTHDVPLKIPENNTSAGSEALIIAVSLTISVVLLIALTVIIRCYHIKVINNKKPVYVKEISWFSTGSLSRLRRAESKLDESKDHNYSNVPPISHAYEFCA